MLADRESGVESDGGLSIRGIVREAFRLLAGFGRTLVCDWLAGRKI